MFKDSYERGLRAALEKVGFLGSVGQTAAKSVGKSFSTKFTKSVDNTKNLVPKLTNQKIGPTGRAGPSTINSFTN